MPPRYRPPKLPDPVERQARLNRLRMPGARGGTSEQVTPVTPLHHYERIPAGVTGGGIGAPYATVVMAAANSKAAAKANADFICDGTDDHLTIQAAVDAVKPTAAGEEAGGRVLLLEGTYRIGGTVTLEYPYIGNPGTTRLDRYLTIEGQGAGTRLSADDTPITFFTVQFSERVAFRHMMVLGNAGDTFLDMTDTGGSFDITDLHGYAGRFIVLDGCDGGLIALNRFDGTEAEFLTETGCTNLHVVHNLIDGVWQEAVDPLSIVYEDDTDGRRVPILDTNGVVKGYAGYSVGATAMGMWLGDADTPINSDNGEYLILVDGSLYMQNADYSGSFLIGPSGQAVLDATNLILINAGAAGIDGTATPSTTAQLADVLVDLGIIASHSIP